MIFDIIIGGFRPFYRDFRDNFSDKWRTRTHPKINIFQISKYSSTPLNKPPQDLSVKEGLGGEGVQMGSSSTKSKDNVYGRYP